MLELRVGRPMEGIEHNGNLLLERLVLPDSDDSPTLVGQEGARALVTLPVTRKLVRPPL